jgi:hypothetical protein
VVSDERIVMALLAEGNPATEVAEEASTGVPAATYLANLEQRSSDMTQLETKKIEGESKRLWTTPWLVAAIAVIVLGVAVIVVNRASDDSPVAGIPTIPLEGAEGDPQAAEAFKAVEAAYHAFNTGDPVWVDVRAMGNVDEMSDEERASGVVDLQANHDMNARIDVSGCESRGYGSWGSVVEQGAPVPSGYYFMCQATETNSLWDVAGIQLPVTYYWVADNGAVQAVRSEEDFAEVDALHEAFDVWLKETHPEVDVDTLMKNPETVPTGVEYAEEFVAQSNEYPIETAAP